MIDDSIEELGDTSEFLLVAREIVISHHEKWNGTGYPHSLEGRNIPLSGRIMAIADVYDALISRRPYKKGFEHDKALGIILKDSGTHFDPTLIELSQPIFPEFQVIAERFKDDDSDFAETVNAGS
jgi:HD-GYP domain-containing protein (c-di-GMP phosphodiesterase class II)